MEKRKQQEIAHYDRIAHEWKQRATQPAEEMAMNHDIEMNSVMGMESYRFLYKLLKQYVPGKRVLDYCCGHGIHAFPILRMGAREVVGIDLSEESLQIARTHAQEHLHKNISFLKMDAEHLDFYDATFDVVFDGGAFSSLDIAKVFPEISRVLKPSGVLIGIETLGHNPLTNLKRWWNVQRGIRTLWAAQHIMKVSDFDKARPSLKVESLYFFHFTSLFVFSLRHLPGGPAIVNLADRLDRMLLSLPFLKRLAFKTVFVLRKL